jgi:hypothetical protein
MIARVGRLLEFYRQTELLARLPLLLRENSMSKTWWCDARMNGLLVLHWNVSPTMLVRSGSSRMKD